MSWVRQMWRSRYVAMLEEENARLKAENRAFLNSLLGVAGFGPVESDESKPVELTRVRKRSWPQVQRMREEQASK